MCRNIKRLRTPDGVPSDEELRLAALQFVRKISGYRVPSKLNETAFYEAVDDIAMCSRVLFDKLIVKGEHSHATR